MYAVGIFLALIARKQPLQQVRARKLRDIYLESILSQSLSRAFCTYFQNFDLTSIYGLPRALRLCVGLFVTGLQHDASNSYLPASLVPIISYDPHLLRKNLVLFNSHVFDVLNTF